MTKNNKIEDKNTMNTTADNPSQTTAVAEPPEEKVTDLPKNEQTPVIPEGDKSGGEQEKEVPSFGERFDKVIKVREDKIKGKIQDNSKKPSDDVATRLENLEKQNEELKKERDTAQKRQSDTHRAFHEKSTELKRLKEQKKSMEDELELKRASSENTSDADENEANLKERLGLTDEEHELLQDNEEFGGLTEKLTKRIDSVERKVSEQTQKELLEKEQAKIQNLEQEMETEWLDSARKEVEDLDGLLRDPDFDTWMKSNKTLMQGIRGDKEDYDPSWLVETANTYKKYQSTMEGIYKGNEQAIRDVMSPSTQGSPKPNDNNKGNFNDRYEAYRQKLANKYKR